MDITHWLTELGLERYAEDFAENDIDADVLPELTADDLREIGVASIGHRRKLLSAIEALAGPRPDEPAPQPQPQPEQVTEPEPAGPTVQQAMGAPADQGERRHLTVMFVDLVGSTEMSTRLDPEDWRAFISAYQDTVAGVVARYEGYVAQFLGDGVLCYFGWPRANEDDAERSVRAGLEIIGKVRGLALPGGERAASRIGIATGLVVVGDLIGSSGTQEASAIGETPNLAARLQGLAQPDQVVVAPATRELVRGVFELRSLGPQQLKGIADPVEPCMVMAENIRESRFAALHAGELTPIVGRDRELEVIQKGWAESLQGAGQMVLLSGEAGIGKSRIIQAAMDRIGEDKPAKVVYQCSPYHAESAFYPIIQQMVLAAGITNADSNAERLEKLAAMPGMPEDRVRLLAPMLGIDAAGKLGALDLTPAQLRARTMQALIDRLREQIARRPTLIVFEDLHWIDPTTLELLDLALDTVEKGQVMILATARPTFEHGFGGHPVVTRLALNRLSQEQILGIVTRITGGKEVPDEVMRLISQRTDGVPLFIEELTKTILESGVLTEDGDALTLDGPLDTMAIPNTLQDSLMARLDRMNTVKEVAQVASCIGREFAHALIAQVSRLDEEALGKALDQLTEAELIYRRGIPPEARYLFKHALVRDAAYESLLKGTRRAIHATILGALEAEPDTEKEVLATHAEAAGQEERAVDLWMAAGEAALARPAFDEGIAHFGRALALLEPKVALEDPAAIEKSLPLLMKQGVASMARKGWGSEATKGAFERALELEAKLGETPLRLTLMYGLMATRVPRGELAAANALGPDFVDLAEKAEDITPACVANRSFAITLTFAGKFERAQKHYDRALSLFDPEKHKNLAAQWGQDLGITSHAMNAFNCAVRGETTRARQLWSECMRYGEMCDDVNSNAYKHMAGTMLHVILRDDAELARHAQALADLSAEYNLIYFGQYSAMAMALARLSGGDLGGIDDFHEAAAVCVSANAVVNIPMLRIEVARRAIAAGKFRTARALLDDAQEMIGRTSEETYLSDLHRLRGALARQAEDTETAVDEFRTAIDIARGQTAKTFELRASVDLARLFVDTGQIDAFDALAAQAAEGIAEGDCTEELAALAALEPVR